MAATGLLVASQLASGMAQASAYEAQASFSESQADINARFAELEAEAALVQGDKDAAEYSKKVRSIVGSQRAALAAQGIDVDSGTALEIQLETAAQGAMDAQTIKNNAWRQSFGLTQESVASRVQGQFDRITGRFQAGAARTTAALQATAYGLEGADKAGWLKPKPSVTKRTS